MLWISGRQRHPARALSIEADLERVLAGPREGYVEDQHCTGFHVHYTGRWLTKLDGALSTQKLGAGVVHKADANGMCADLRPASPHPKDEMSPGVDGREVREPDVLEHAEHAELALLIDQGVVGDNSEVEVQGSADSDGRNDVVLFDLVHHIHAFSDLPEDGVHLVEMRLR